jgi:hypothetical protein
MPILSLMEGPQLRTVEDVSIIEHKDAPGLTTDSREQFLSDYSLHEEDLAGLGEVALHEPKQEPEGGDGAHGA